MLTRNQLLALVFVLALLGSIFVAKGNEKTPLPISRKELRSHLSPVTGVKFSQKPSSSFRSNSKTIPLRRPSSQDSISLSTRIPIPAKNEQSFLSRLKKEQRNQAPSNTKFVHHVLDLPRDSVRPSLDQGNDACPATVIPSLPYADSGTTIGRGDDYWPSCITNGSSGPDVIYALTPTLSTYYQISLSHFFVGSILAIRTGGACPGTTEIACANGDALFRPHLVAGETYYIIIDGCGTSGDYTLSVRGSDCVEDFTLLAPGSSSGNLCFSHNNCLIDSGVDQTVRVTIPHEGLWSFSLCDGQSWQAGLHLMSECCNGWIADGTFNCPNEYSYRPVIHNVHLVAGEYYLDIESLYDQCGPWTLTVSEWICSTPPPNDNCESVTPVSLPTTFTGNNDCATLDGPGISENEVWHAFTLNSAGSIYMDYCGTPDSIQYFEPILLRGCPWQDFIFADYYYYRPCAGNNTLRAYFSLVPEGTWYIPVIGDTWTSHGPYNLNVWSVPPCDIESEAGDVIECEETPGPAHNTSDCNGGCNNTQPHFQDISPDTSVFGRTFTYYIGQDLYRDTDWYRFLLEDTNSISISLLADFSAIVSIVNVENCVELYSFGYSILYERCDQSLMISDCLPPGTYAVVIAEDAYDTTSSIKNYRFTISSSSCSICSIEAQPGEIEEGEPICSDGYDDEFNVGCNGNESYSDISCGQTIIGTSGVYHYSWGADTVLYRDTDWYRFTITESQILSWTVEASFPAQIAICYGCDDEFDMAIDYAVIHPCRSVTLTTPCVRPGTYYGYVSPAGWGPFPCGSPYRATINCSACGECDSLEQTGDLREDEPICSENYVDNFNGGCDSDPPVYGLVLPLDHAVMGTSGIWWRRATDRILRDTDWYTFSTATPAHVRWCAVGQFPLQTIILGPSATHSCDSIQAFSDFAQAGACDTACASAFLPAGDYYLFVSPQSYDGGVYCGQEYRAWISRQPCTPDSVTDVSIRSIGHNIVLRWTSNTAFIGSFSIYRSNDDVPYPGTAWTVVASDIPPVSGIRRTSYTLTNAIDTNERQYYLVIAVCP